MKKEYKKPEIEVVELSVENIITASSGYKSLKTFDDELDDTDVEWKWKK